ncbi:MAG: hypothetical protein KAY24_02765 [Candidatus Eisenbacteria sp.]|nr:hypothetical protein [Candidatus Eisenbacteria bacterium]
MNLVSVQSRHTAGAVAALLALCALTAATCSAHWAGPDPFETNEPGASLYAIRQPNVFFHNVGLLEIMVTNVGVIGNRGWIDAHGAGWKGGEYLYAAALWVGAIASDNLAHVSQGAYEAEFRPSWDPVDTIYPTFEGASGGDRVGFSRTDGDDDQDGLRDEDPLNGKDDDGDGKIDEDFEAISQQMFSCEYWDYTDEAMAAYPTHRPLHLKVRQRSFAWSAEGENEFVGLDYRISNDGFEAMRDIYIGYFVDSDAGNKAAPGYWMDDRGELRSIDTTYVDPAIDYYCTDQDGSLRNCAIQKLHIDIAYMHDASGREGGSSSDDMPPGADGYFGGMFLGHTTDPLGYRAPPRVEIHTCCFFSESGVYPNGDPRTDFERYDLLSRGSKPRGPADDPSDYRYVFSAGPFRELLPGEELEFQMAFVIGNKWPGLRQNAINAQRIYKGKWRDADGLEYTGCQGRETCLHIEPGGAPLIWQDPCDSLDTGIAIKNTRCDEARFWVDNDCDCCTPIQISATSCDGWETLVHWIGTVAPPPPNVSTQDPRKRARVEGDRCIKLEWDNASELVADPLSGQILFCGYRIWRVENWKRPIGSIGPAPTDWQLIADLSVNNERKQPIGSQLDLTDFTNPYAPILDTLPHPTHPGERLYQYEVGRYFFLDTLGLKNGMIYFYDITAYSCWTHISGDGMEVYSERARLPSAVTAEGVRPRWDAVPADQDWKSRVMVVPNPWRGGAAWDLIVSDSDPTGTHIDFARLPDRECKVMIYTLAGDLVQTLHHNGRAGNGTVRWNMITRNGQDITSGVYLYAVTCDHETLVGRFTVIR